MVFLPFQPLYRHLVPLNLVFEILNVVPVPGLYKLSDFEFQGDTFFFFLGELLFQFYVFDVEIRHQTAHLGLVADVQDLLWSVSLLDQGVLFYLFY